ncbi:MAG: hypothetical protein ACYCW6_12545, partial [Candidatus Xenobia bacterium]
PAPAPGPAPPAPWGAPPANAPAPPPVTPYDAETARPFAPRAQAPPIIDSRRRGVATSRMGSNLVINVPAQPAQSGLQMLPPRLEVIYGNFSPTDPREIVLYENVERSGEVRFVFSSSPGDSIYHLQLNHFTVYPELHAEMIKQGEHDFVLHNRVPHGQEERFQTRVNGAVLNEGESRKLQSGDILSLGIYRLRYSL